ncbi:MAG: D-alanine--D-alanine ligase [Mariprofundaceae bacterium]|nr:D-alanine--D-alanine ligase [Mariprofundaceae bacterium]
MSTKRIAVLMGGSSAERLVSLRSGNAVLAALKRLGHTVHGVDVKHAADVLETPMDVAFIALHGTFGEDGCVQGLLEMMGIPYTGSGVMCSAVCMNKQVSKRLLRQAGLNTAVDIPLTKEGPSRYPVFIKPVAEGSSIGLHRIASIEAWRALQIPAEALHLWMAEMPIKGLELAISVLNGEALPPVEIVAHSGCYDYKAKYSKGATDYYSPARLPPESLRYSMEQAEAAVRALGCRGAPRVDLIVDGGGQAMILEVNTVPGMTETSLLPKAAMAAGIDFDDLCGALLSDAALDHVHLSDTCDGS